MLGHDYTYYYDHQCGECCINCISFNPFCCFIKLIQQGKNCCGSRKYEYPIFYLKDNHNKGAHEASQQSLSILQVTDRFSLQKNLGVFQYVEEYEMAFLCCECFSQKYKQLKINGARAAKITGRCEILECCKCYDDIQSPDGKRIGSITQEYRSCCNQGHYFSVQDNTGKEIYGLEKKKICCPMFQCLDYIPWEIKTPQQAKLTDVIYRPNVDTGCCSRREQIDVHLPQKASDKDKLLLLTAANYVILRKK